MENLPKIIVIVGPTASGKTSLSISLAKQFNGEIISADSRQIYTHMDIGSAKPSLEEREGIPHYGFDLVNPDTSYNVVEFQQYCFKKIEDILKRGKTPFIVGGTGLYVAAVVDNYTFVKYDVDETLRKKLENMDLDSLVTLLKEKDKKALSIDDWSNKRRVIRALEYCISTKKKFSEAKTKGNPKYEFVQLGVGYHVDQLDERIKQRIDITFEQGLLDEIDFLEKEYGFDVPGMKSISYQEFKAYKEGKESLEEIKEKIFFSTRQYAKRQMTWFKKDSRIMWLSSKEEGIQKVQKFLLHQI